MPTRHRSRAFDVSLDGTTLSGLFATPDESPQALIVALHGHGMTARYFAGPADPAQSLLELGAELGYSVWAPDRPGYGASSGVEPSWFPMFRQRDVLRAAIDQLTERVDVGAGLVLVGHSFGFKLALALAAAPPHVPLLGVAGSGTGIAYTFTPGVGQVPPVCPGDMGAAWGPPDLYPASLFDRDVNPAAPIASPPASEAIEWIDDVGRFGPRIRVPLMFTFGEHDRIFRVDDEHLAALRDIFASSPKVVCEVQEDAAHNVSLAHVGRAHHLRVLAFADECVHRRRGRVDPPHPA